MKRLSHFFLIVFLGLIQLSGYCQYTDSKTVYIGTKISLHKILPQTVYSQIKTTRIKNNNISLKDSFVLGNSLGNDSLYLYNTLNEQIANINFIILPYTKLDTAIISPSSITCYVYDTVRLTFFPSPFSASISFFEWIVDKNIATIDKNGLCKALSEGNTVAKLITYPSSDTFRIAIQVKTCKPPVVTDSLHICNNGSVLLVSNNNKTEWYTDKELKNKTAKGIFYNPKYTIGENMYYAIINDGSCKSTPSFSRIIVHDIPPIPNLTGIDSVFSIDSIKNVTLGKTLSWYEKSTDILPLYKGSGLPPNISEGKYSYVIKQGDICESNATRFSFQITKSTIIDSITISGKIGGVEANFKGIIQLLTVPNYAIYSQQFVTGNTFSLHLKKHGNFILKVTPLNSSNHLPFYLGNTTEIENAFVLNIRNYNIGGLYIEKPGVSVANQEESGITIYQQNNSLVVELNDNKKIYFKMYTIQGQTVLEGNLHQGINNIPFNLSKGIYLFTTENFVKEISIY